MRKLFIPLTALAILLTGCYKDEVESIGEKVDNLNESVIPSMKKQISSMEASVQDIQEADTKIQETISAIQTKYLPLVTDAVGFVAALSEDVQDLKDGETALYKSIDNLKTFIKEETASKTWMENTFATLDQQTALQDSLSKVSGAIVNINNTLRELEKAYEGSSEEALKTVRVEVEQMNQQVLDKISSTETGIKQWVNEKFDAYYTAAKTQELINTLAASINGRLSQLSPEIAENAEDIAENLQEIQRLGEELTNVRDEVTEGYKQAIKEAIFVQSGDISDEVAQKINDLNAYINREIETVQAKVDALEARIAKLEADILALSRKINSADDQISAIEATIEDLKSIDNLLKQAIADNKTLTSRQADSLKKIDTELLARITELRLHINETLKGKEDLLTQTFATLEQHNLLKAEIDNLSNVIKGIGANVNQDIATIRESIPALDTKMTKWVNEELQKQYDDLSGKINTLRSDVAKSDDTLKEDLLKEISKTEKSLEDAIANAISETLQKNDGLITDEIVARFNELTKVIEDNYKELEALVKSLRKDADENASSIQTINGQIEKINKTIETLLKVEASLTEAYKKADEALKEELSKQITEVSETVSKLKSYVGTLPAGTKETNLVDWINATFTTLDNQSESAVAIQSLKDCLDSIAIVVSADSVAIAKGIKAEIDGVKKLLDETTETVISWINEQLKGYVQLDVYNKKIQALDSKIGELSAEDSKLTQEVSELKTEIGNKISGLQNEYKQLLAEAIQSMNGVITAALSSEIGKVNPDVVSLTGRVDQLEKDFAALAARVENCESDISVILAQLAGIQKTETVKSLIDAVESAVEALKASTGKSIKELEEAVAALQKQTAEITGLITRIGTAEDKIKALEALVGNFKSEDLNSAILKLQEDLAKAVADDAASFKKLSESIESIEKTIAVIDDLCKRLAEAESAIDKLQEKVGDIKNEDLKKGIDNLVSGLAAIKGTSTKSLSELESDLAALEEQVYNTDQVLDRLVSIESVIESLKGKVGDIKSADLMASVEKLDEDLAKITGNTTSSLADIETSLANLQKRVYETDEALERIIDCETKIAAIQAKVGDINSKDLNDAITTLDGTLSKLSSDLAEVTGSNTMSIEQIEAALTTVNGTLTNLSQSITAINETIDGATGIKAAIESINSTLADVYDKTTVDGMISNLNQTLAAAIETSVSNIVNGALDGYKTLADLQGHIERIDASITTITEQIGTINTAISNVYTKDQVDGIKSDLQTAIANEITTAISNLVNGASGEYDTLGEIETAITAINTTLTGIGTSITDIETALGNRYTKDDVNLIKAGLETALTNAINGVIAGASEGYKTLEDIETKIKAIDTTLKGLGDSIDGIEDKLKEIYTKTEVDDIKDKLDKALKDAIDGLIGGASEGFETLKGIEGKILEIYSTIESISPSIPALAQSLGNYFTKTQVDSVSTSIKNALSAAINGLVDGASDGFKTLHQIETTIGGIKSSIDGLTTAIGTINDKLADVYTKTQVDSIKTKLSEAIEKSVNDAVSGLVNGASTGYQTLKGIEEKIGEIKTTLTTYGNSIADIKTELLDIYTKGQVDSIDSALKYQLSKAIADFIDGADDDYNTLKKIQTKIEGISENIASIRISVKGIETKLSDRYTKAQVNNMLDSLKTVVMEAIVGEATEGYKTLADIEGKLKGIDTSIEGINTSIATINTTLGMIYSKHQVDSIKTVIGDETEEAIRTAIGGLVGNAGTGYKTLGDIEVRLSEVGTTLTTYGNSINDIKTALKGIYTKTQVDSIDSALKNQIAKAVTDLISGAGDDYNTLKKIQTKIEGLSRDISSINTSISGIETKLSDRFTKAQVNHMLDSLKTVVIDAIVDGAEDYQTLKDIEIKLKTVDTSIEGINTAISGIQTQLGKIYTKTQVDSISDVIRRELETEVTGLLNGADKYKDFITVQGHIDTLYSRVTKISTAVASLKGQLANYYSKEKVNELTAAFTEPVTSAILGGATTGYTTLGDIQTKIEGITESIGGINTSIQNIDQALGNVFTKTQVDSVHTKITSEITAAVDGLINGARNYKDFKTVQGHIDTLYKRVSVIVGDITGIKSDLSKIYTKTEVDNLVAGQINTLKSEILGSATGDYQTLGGIQTILGTLSGTVDGLSTSIGQIQTALTGKLDQSEIETITNSIKDAIRTEILGGADDGYKTLKEFENLIIQLQGRLDNIDTDANVKNLIKSYIDDLKGGATTSGDTLAKLEGLISGFDQRIKDLLAEIQGITYVPESSSDYSVGIKSGKITVDFMCSPDTMSTTLKNAINAGKVTFELSFIKTEQTRANVPFMVITVSKNDISYDADRGLFSATADISSMMTDIKNGKKHHVALTMNKEGKPVVTTQFVPLAYYPVTKLQIVPDEGFFNGNANIKKGITAKVHLVVNDGKPYSNLDVQWSVDPTNKATVTPSSDGLSAEISGQHSGAATIIAKNGDVTGRLPVNVLVYPESISLNPGTIYIPVGYTAQLSPTINPSDYSEGTVSYSYTNKDGSAATGLTISDSGLITANSLGCYTVTGKINTLNGETSGNVDVVVFDFSVGFADSSQSWDSLSFGYSGIKAGKSKSFKLSVSYSSDTPSTYYLLSNSFTWTITLYSWKWSKLEPTIENNGFITTISIPSDSEAASRIYISVSLSGKTAEFNHES